VSMMRNVIAQERQPPSSVPVIYPTRLSGWNQPDWHETWLLA